MAGGLIRSSVLGSRDTERQGKVGETLGQEAQPGHKRAGSRASIGESRLPKL